MKLFYMKLEFCINSIEKYYSKQEKREGDQYKRDRRTNNTKVV